MADIRELMDQHDQLILLYNAISNQRVQPHHPGSDPPTLM
jgi:hypothetical protein